jgi:hypothetical protein
MGGIDQSASRTSTAVLREFLEFLNHRQLTIVAPLGTGPVPPLASRSKPTARSSLVLTFEVIETT